MICEMFLTFNLNDGVSCIISSVPQNIVMELNDVMIPQVHEENTREDHNM